MAFAVVHLHAAAQQQAATALPEFECVAEHLQSGPGLELRLDTRALPNSTVWVRELGAALFGERGRGAWEGLLPRAQLLARAFEDTGLGQTQGLLLRSGTLESGLYTHTAALYKSKDMKAPGTVWRLFGTQTHALAGNDLLPASTVYAVYGRLKPDVLWAWWDKLGQRLEAPAVTEWQARVTKAASERGVNLRSAVSTAAEGGVLVLSERRLTHADPKEKSDPAGPPSGPALVLVLKTRSSYAYSNLESYARKQQGAVFQSVGELRQMVLPPRRTVLGTSRPAIGYFSNFLVLTTCHRATLAILAAHKGTGTRLVQRPVFRRVSEGLSGGVSSKVIQAGFHYVSPGFGRILDRAARPGAGETTAAAAHEGTSLLAYGVLLSEPSGLLYRGNSNRRMTETLLATLLAPTVVARAILTPAPEPEAPEEGAEPAGAGEEQPAPDSNKAPPPEAAPAKEEAPGAAGRAPTGSAAPVSPPADRAPSAAEGDPFHARVGRELGAYAASKLTGKKVLFVMPPNAEATRPHRICTDSMLRGFQLACGESVQVVGRDAPTLPERAPDGKPFAPPDCSAEDWGSLWPNAAAFDAMIRRHLDKCDVVVSTIGLPAELGTMKFWKMKKRPGLVLVHGSVYELFGAIRLRMVVAAVAGKPAAQPQHQSLGIAAVPFAERCLLITPDNLYPIRKLYPGLFK